MQGKKNAPGSKLRTIDIAYEDHPMASLHHAVNQLFDDFFMSFELMPLTEFEDLCVFVPRVNMTDDGQVIKITAELPGMEKEAIEVNVDADCLTIRGKKSTEENSSSTSRYCMERIFGNFNRAIKLPKGVNASRASAVYRNGVLTVNIPRRKGYKSSRRIKISNDS